MQHAIGFRGAIAPVFEHGPTCSPKGQQDGRKHQGDDPFHAANVWHPFELATRMKATTRTWVVLAATVMAVLVTGRLGWWQLDRAAQKIALQNQLVSRRDLPSLSTAELARVPERAADQHYRRVVLQGRWIAERSVFLDNRQMDAHAGFYLVTPLEIAPGLAVLVQRGWAPRDIRDRTLVPSIETPAGPVMLEGRVMPAPGQLYALGGPDLGKLRQNLRLEDFAREIGVHLLPLSIQQEDASASAPGQPTGLDGLKRHWPDPAVDVQKHYGYAFQWFAMSALLTGLYVWYQLLQPWLRRRRGAA